ncbi:hypothetical protein, partial [Arthrobacter koreensis]
MCKVERVAAGPNRPDGSKTHTNQPGKTGQFRMGPEGLLQPVWMEFHGIHRIAKTVRMEYAGKTHSGAK